MYHIDAHQYEPKDPFALGLMWKKQQENDGAPNTTTSHICELTIMPQRPYFEFLRPSSMIELTYDRPYPTLMHIKNTHHATKINEHSQRIFFEKALMLSPEEEAKVIGKVRFSSSKSWSLNATINQG
jgi:hypothetical protein